MGVYFVKFREEDSEGRLLFETSKPILILYIDYLEYDPRSGELDIMGLSLDTYSSKKSRQSRKVSIGYDPVDEATVTHNHEIFLNNSFSRR